MCFFWLIRKVYRERKIIRALTTYLHNMLFTASNQPSVSFITFNRLWARIAEHSFNYPPLSSLICWLINQVHKIIVKPLFVCNMSTHLYSTKLLRNNYITLLYLYKSLNYESSLMRNNYYILKNDARYRSRFAIITTKKKDWINNAKLSNIEIVKIKDSKLSDLKTSSSIMIYYCDSAL